MKYNPQKLQQGGGMPFVSYQPFDYNPQTQTAPKQSAPAKTEEKSGTDLLSKEVINEIIKTGMPNEVETFLKQLKQVENSGPFTSSFDTNKLYDLAAKGNQIITNSKLMGEATTKAYENGGLDELAVTSTGGLYVRDSEGSLSTVSMGDFAKNRDKYQALSVNDLSQARRYDTKLSFDKTIISTVQNAIGIDKVSDHIVEVLKKLGSETTESNRYQSGSDYYKNAFQKGVTSLGGKQPTESQTEGLKQLSTMYNKMGNEGILNIKTENETQRNHIKDASAYILATMSPNAVNLLKARAIVNGTSASPENLIAVAFESFTNDKHTSNIGYEADISKLGTGVKGTAEKTYNQTPMEQIINGDLNTTTMSLINPDKSNYGMILKGSMIGKLPDINGKPLPMAPLGRVLDSGLGVAVDQNNMFFGDKGIKPYEKDQIIYGGGEAIKTMVPVDVNGHPNLKALEQFESAEKSIASKGLTTPEQKNAEYAKYGLQGIQLGTDGKLTTMSTKYLKPFIVTHGYSTNGVASALNNDYTHTVDSSEQKGVTTMLQGIYNKYKLTFPAAPTFTSNKIVQAPIFMPILQGAQNTVSAYEGHGSVVHANTLFEDIQRQPSSATGRTGADILHQ